MRIGGEIYRKRKKALGALLGLFGSLVVFFPGFLPLVFSLGIERKTGEKIRIWISDIEWRPRVVGEQTSDQCSSTQFSIDHLSSLECSAKNEESLENRSDDSD